MLKYFLVVKQKLHIYKYKYVNMYNKYNKRYSNIFVIKSSQISFQPKFSLAHILFQKHFKPSLFISTYLTLMQTHINYNNIHIDVQVCVYKKSLDNYKNFITVSHFLFMLFLLN